MRALDLLYFWMYQPPVPAVLLSTLTEEERHILITAQMALLRKREISQMFIDGVLGQDFARALSLLFVLLPGLFENPQTVYLIMG